MLFLLEDGGEHSVKELAGRLGLSLPAASRAVDGLIQRGYVTRRESRRGPALAARRPLRPRPRGRGRGAPRAARDARRRSSPRSRPSERDSLLAALLPIAERITRQ